LKEYPRHKAISGTQIFNNRRKEIKESLEAFDFFFQFLFVAGHDFTFARSQKGHQRVGYGEAGDCYSTANCPQGRFSINLQETGLRVSPHTSWAGHGHRASLWINRLDVIEIIAKNVEAMGILIHILLIRTTRKSRASAAVTAVGAVRIRNPD
jgi:hypothetical protein